MNVTRHNASLIFDEFNALMQGCEFYAVDQEMTGITCTDSKHDFGMDLAESYVPRRAAAVRYTAFQFGVCLFTKGNALPGGATEYVARPFNFYLRKDGDADVQLNMSAVQFLVDNKMDFNKWLSSGLQYCDAKKEASEVTKLTPPDTAKDLTEEEMAWVTKMVDKVGQWYSSEDAAAQPLKLTDPHIHSKADNALHYKLQELNIAVDPRLDLGIPTYYRKVTTITKVSVEAFAESQRVEKERKQAALNKLIGFRRFWKALVDSKKPQIGHNYSSDLMFMMNQHDATLSSSYTEFKAAVHGLFPCIYDTKVLSAAIPAGATPFKNTALEPLFTEVVKKPIQGKSVVKLPMGFEEYHPMCLASSSKAHEGAFDAYMTGIVYLHLRTLFTEAHVAAQQNLIASFGSLYTMNLTPDQPDLLPPAAYYVTVPSSVGIREFTMTDAQFTKWSEAKSKKDKDEVAVDFYVRYLGPTACVVVFPLANTADMAAFKARLSAGIARAIAKLPSEEEKTAAVASINENSIFDGMTMFADWKAQAKAALPEPAQKKGRVE